MKKLFFLLLVLGAFTASAEEVAIRLTDQNISTLTSSIDSECTGYRQILIYHHIFITLTDRTAIEIKSKGEDYHCGNAIDEAREKGRQRLKELNDVKNGDLIAEGSEGSFVCYKLVGNIIYDTVTNQGQDFTTKMVVAPCPK